MKRISDYRVISRHELTRLESVVMDFINDGWEPFYGVAVCAVAGGILYNQAVVKYEEIN